jgi:hypothetical protein
LLNKKDRDARLLKVANDPKYILDNARGETETWLVEHEQSWSGHQGPADGQHLAFAPGQGAGELGLALPEARETGENFVHSLVGPRVSIHPPRIAPQKQIVLDRHAGEELSRLWNEANASLQPFLRRELLNALTLEPNYPAARLETHEAVQHGGLAGAIRSNDRSDFACRKSQPHISQSCDLSI